MDRFALTNPENARTNERERDHNKAGYTAQDAPSTRLKITGDGRKDGPTDGRTDTPSYRDAKTHLKTKTKQLRRASCHKPVRIRFDSASHLPNEVPQLREILSTGCGGGCGVDAAHSRRISSVDDVVGRQSTVERQDAGGVEDFH